MQILERRKQATLTERLDLNDELELFPDDGRGDVAAIALEDPHDAGGRWARVRDCSRRRDHAHVEAQRHRLGSRLV